MSGTDNEDTIEQMLKKTGCIDYHYKVQDCIAETKDWRLCQTEVKEFKSCMDNYTRSQKLQKNSE